MPDHRETDSAGGPQPSPIRDAPGRPPKDAAIKAVSDLLSRKKPAIDRISAPGSARLPKFPRSLEATISDLKKSPSLRAKLGPTRTSLEPPPVALPDGASPGRPSGDEPPSGEPHGDGSPEVTVGSDRTWPASVPSGPVGRGPESADPPPENRGSASRPGPSLIPIREGQGSTGTSTGTGGPAPSVAAGVEGRFTHRDPGPIERGGLPGELPGPPGTVQAPSIDLPREARSSAGPAAGREAEAIRPGVPASRSGLAAGAGTISSTHTASSTITVRNPLASGVGHLSVTPQDSPGGGGLGAGPDATGTGSAGSSFGGSATPQGGGSIDLSKTNELLRQLVDAVKKQRDASLPVGGQSIYPGR